jgi:uncharacterized membrane protein
MSNFKGFFSGIKAGFKNFSLLVSDVVNLILLVAVYFIGVGLTSMVAKIFNRHFLDLKKPTDKSSYWLDLNLSRESKDNYYRQF